MDPITCGIIGLAVYFLTKSDSGNGGFSYKKKNGSWRAYFNDTPPSKSHVLHDSDGYYVCWDQELNTEQEARQVAQQWTKNYG